MSTKTIDLIELGHFVYEHRREFLDAMYDKKFHDFAFEQQREHRATLYKLMDLVGIDPQQELADLDAAIADREKFGFFGWILECERRAKANKP